MTEQSDLTTFHVRQAVEGSSSSIEWLVKRFTPALTVTAEYRMGKTLRAQCDPEDIVNELWMATIPNLPALEPRDTRFTPVLMRYLSTALVRRVNNSTRRAIRRQAASLDVEDSAAETPEFAAEISGVVTRAIRDEEGRRLREALDELSAAERELVIRRGFEQASNAEVAEALGIEPNTAAKRYQRALEKLKERLPGGFIEDLR